VAVVLDIDLAVGVASDEHHRVDGDHPLACELLEAVPIGPGSVRVGVGGDVEIDGRLVSHGVVSLGSRSACGDDHRPRSAIGR
jgi:hypothetical protein